MQDERRKASPENDSKCQDQQRPSGKEIHIAPMLDVSKREFRQFHRILSKRCVLWTEMIVDETLAYSNNPNHHLDYEPNSHPIIVQIGGNSPKMTAAGVQLMEKWGYDEINLNCECPSDRVSGKREFGAALMKKSNLALQMVKSMNEQADKVPISVKARIGVDDWDDFDFLCGYIAKLRPHCKRFIVHARKVLLKGLNPAQNRRIPPLNYARVYQLCRAFPDCDFWINGGIPGLQAARDICHGRADVDPSQHTDVPCRTCDAPFGSCVAPPGLPAPSNLKGCMFGRAAVDNPAMFWDVDRFFYGEPVNPCQNRREVLDKYRAYLETIYPPRCRDDDERITSRMPAPEVTQTRTSCPVCCPDEDGNRAMPTSEHAKITSRVIDRALKPTLNIFFNMKGSKRYRQSCSSLARDLRIRNCGPAFILKQAMQSVATDALDAPFVRTENLTVERVGEIRHSCVDSGCNRTNSN